jgi:hypothetical protein
MGKIEVVMINNDFNLSFGIKGFAEVKDKNGNII